MKIFETSELENCKLDINKTWTRYVPLYYPKNEGVNEWRGWVQTKKHQKMPWN